MTDNERQRLAIADSLMKQFGLDAYMGGADDQMRMQMADAGTPLNSADLSNFQVVLRVLEDALFAVNVFNGGDLGGVALPTQVIGPVNAEYQQMIRYFMANPSLLQFMNISSSESNTSAPVLNSMAVTPTRVTPFGGAQSNRQFFASFKTPQDYQLNRVVVPLRERLDTITFLRFTSTDPAPADVDITITFYFSERAEVRQVIQPSGPNYALGTNGVLTRLPTAGPVRPPLAINPAALAAINRNR